jgi:hypothetical protein
LGRPEFGGFEDWIMMHALQQLTRWTLLTGICCLAPTLAALAADGTAAQHRAAEEYLAAVASGDPQALAQTIHDDELELLRTHLLDELKLEGDRNESLLRSRLFGVGMPLSSIERLTRQNFFVALAQRLRFGGRVFERVDWLAAVPDSGGMVLMVGRIRPPKEMGSVRVPVLVALVPWGKDWKAALPLELQAQIDDLRAGRVRSSAPPAVAAAPGAATGAAAAAPKVATSQSPAAILELLQTAEDNLKARRCEDFYGKQMSPNFRRTTAAKALRALVTSCENRDEVRERLLAAFSLARNVTPHFEYAGTRAIYDLRGQGLPFPQLVMEQVDKRWYIAE